MASTKKTPKSFKGKNAISVDQDAIDYILSMVRNKDMARNHIGAVNAMSEIEDRQWDGDGLVPAGSPLDTIVDAFKSYSDLPVDLPMHSFLTYLAAWLLNAQVTLLVADESGGGQRITPEIWTICLAPSGAGKTFSSDMIKPAAPVKANIQGIGSGPAFFEALMKNEQEGVANFMFVDEVGQQMQQMEQLGSPLTTLKEHLLNAYVGGELVYATVTKGERIVRNSRLCFLGLNTTKAYLDGIKLVSFEDGFMQRFGFIIADRDPNRPVKNFPRYNAIKIQEAAEKAWDKVLSVMPLKEYIYSKDALKYYDAKFYQFAEMIEKDGVVEVSFFRRLMQRAHKLALLYHIIQGKTAVRELDESDVALAMRMTERHIRDIGRAILYKSGNAAGILEKVEHLKQKMDERGVKMLPSTITQNIREVKDGAFPAKTLFKAMQNARGSDEDSTAIKLKTSNRPKSESQNIEITNDDFFSNTGPLCIDDLITGHRDERGISTLVPVSKPFVALL